MKKMSREFFMNKELCLKLAEYFLENKSTVRKTAQHFNISKSGAHNYLHKNLRKINYSLFKKVQKLLDKNNREKHIRGGESTKRKFKNNNQNS